MFSRWPRSVLTTPLRRGRLSVLFHTARCIFAGSSNQHVLRVTIAFRRHESAVPRGTDSNGRRICAVLPVLISYRQERALWELCPTAAGQPSSQNLRRLSSRAERLLLRQASLLALPLPCPWPFFPFQASFWARPLYRRTGEGAWCDLRGFCLCRAAAHRRAVP